MLADYHTHCWCSSDSRTPPEDQARAALDRGLEALCLTDHVDLFDREGRPTPASRDWSRVRETHRQLNRDFGDRLQLPLGVELGEASADFPRADRYLDDIPEMDFIIASQHNVSPRFGGRDLICCDLREMDLEGVLADYFEALLAIARWGRFSVLGHLTLPDRYAQRRCGLPPLDFAPHADRIDAILRCLAETGRGLECNTSRGRGPLLPEAPILRRYRELGGEIITIGSDAHSPESVGAGVRETQELLRDLGFRYICTFRALEPVFHRL